MSTQNYAHIHWLLTGQGSPRRGEGWEGREGIEERPASYLSPAERAVLDLYSSIDIHWLLTGQGSPRRGEGWEGREGIEERPASYLSPAERAVLDLYRAVDTDAQREIQAVAEEKKRLREIERQLRALQADLAAVKRLA